MPGNNFTLKYQLADNRDDMHALVEQLAAAGCDDALVCIGLPGRLALEFSREAENAGKAVRGGGYRFDRRVLEVARVILEVNLAKESNRHQ